MPCLRKSLAIHLGRRNSLNISRCVKAVSCGVLAVLAVGCLFSRELCGDPFLRKCVRWHRGSDRSDQAWPCYRKLCDTESLPCRFVATARRFLTSSPRFSLRRSNAPICNRWGLRCQKRPRVGLAKRQSGSLVAFLQHLEKACFSADCPPKGQAKVSALVSDWS